MSAVAEPTVAIAGGKLMVTRYRWPSGLVLLLLCDHRAPIVSLQTWYRVGGRHHRPGKSGIAHLFEHLMFNRTESTAAGEFDRLIERTGGDSNAATWVDWTYYRVTLPARDLELGVRLEADRMTNLLLTPEVIETEREVVINERLECVDNDVEGYLDEQLFHNLFTRHPYGVPVIGWLEEIRAITAAEIADFYRRYYSPGNTTLVLVGDVDPAPAVALIDRYYGGIPAAELPAEAALVEPRQQQARRLVFERAVPAPRLVIGYPAPGQQDPDWVALDLLATLLCGSPSARLYRRLVIETEIASSVNAQVMPFRDPGLLELSVNLRRGRRAADAEAVIEEVIGELGASPVDDAELLRAKNCAETEIWSSLVSCDGKAEALGHFESTLGDFRELDRVARGLAEMTSEELCRVAGRYLAPSLRTTIVAEPEGSG